MFNKKPVKIVFLLLVCALFVSCGRAGKPEARFGTLRVFVTDGFSETPIPGARVVVPETGEAFYTGSDGMTERMRLPVIQDREYDRLLPCSLGRLTLIVFAEGYAPYMLLYVRIEANREREPIPVLLFPDDGTLPVFTVIEAPPSEWAEELVKRYR